MTPLPQSVLDLIASGQKIEAIKEVRALTGLGLREAKDAVDQIERGESVSMSSLPHSGRPMDAVPPGELATRVFDLIEEGQTIQAIKEVRSATGVGLAEAKQIVEQVAAGQSRDASAASTSQPATSPSSVRVLVAVAMAGVIVLFAIAWLLAA